MFYKYFNIYHSMGSIINMDGIISFENCKINFKNFEFEIYFKISKLKYSL